MWYSTQDGWQFWHEHDPYQHGPYLHRERLPSIIAPDGTQYICLNNKIVRTVIPGDLMKSMLFLDDNPDRTRAFLGEYPHAETVETAEEAILFLQEKEYDFVFLDHDLGGEAFVDSNRSDTGMEVVRWIVENEPKIGKVIVHSHNTDAAPLMTMILDEAGFNTSYIPFRVIIKDYRGL